MAVCLRSLLLAPGVIVGMLGLPSLARAQWIADGNPVCTFPGVQFDPGIVPDGSGGAVIFWIDGRDLPPDLYGLRVTSQGGIAPGWPADGVYLGTGVADWIPKGVPDGTGGAIIAWEDDSDFPATGLNIYAQRVTGDGQVPPGWPADGLAICTAPRYQRSPRLLADGAGGAIIAWRDQRNDPGPVIADPIYNVYALRITAEGTVAPGWVAGGTPICTRPEGQFSPTLAPDGSGGAFITWDDFRVPPASHSDIYAQRVTSSGEVALGWLPDGLPVCTAIGGQNRPIALTDGNGGAIIIWKDFRSFPGAGEGSGYEDLYGLRILGDGAIASGWPVDGLPLCRAPDVQQDVRAAPDGLGGAILSWEDYRSYALGTGTASDIYAQRVTGDGVIPLGWPPDGKALCFVADFQLTPTLAPDGAGGAFVAWEDLRPGSHLEDVYAQHVLASGAIAPGWDGDGLAVCTARAGQRSLVSTSDGLGGAIVAWYDGRDGGDQIDIFAHKLGIDGPVPTRPSLVSAEAEADRVVLFWYARDVSQAVVERRTSYSDWLELGPAKVESTSILSYEDRTVTPGERYGYRLGYWDGGVRDLTEETWVEVPRNLQFALHGFSPNPAVGAPSVSLTLAKAEATRLEVYDPRGRLVIRRDLTSLGPGRHLIPLNTGVRLASGVYLLRLTQAGSIAQVRGVVLD